MGKMLSLVLAAGLLAFSPATFAADYGSPSSPQMQQRPPVAQPLVREGSFAIKLATELGLGSPSDEAAAEDLLAKAGISPADGWISDYPVTPEIIGQLDESLKQSEAEGNLQVPYETAKQDILDIATELALPVPAEEGTQTAEAPPAPPDVTDYSSTDGPPVVTYYEPPPEYAYLYDWVPYPASWFGISFAGFFICHQFSRVVTVGPEFGFHHPHRAIVTNRFMDPATRRPLFMEHGFQGAGHTIRPHTMLRTEQGRAFGSFGRSGGPGGGSRRMIPMTPHVRPVLPQQSPAPHGSQPRSFGSRNMIPMTPHVRPVLPQQSPAPHGSQPRSFGSQQPSFNTPHRSFNAPRPPSSANTGRIQRSPNACSCRTNAFLGCRKRRRWRPNGWRRQVRRRGWRKSRQLRTHDRLHYNEQGTGYSACPFPFVASLRQIGPKEASRFPAKGLVMTS